MDTRTLRKFGVWGLLNARYKGSHYFMLKAVYPEHDWVPWKFKTLPQHVGLDPDVLAQAITFVETEKKVLRPQDWYSISNRQLRELGVLSIIDTNGGLFESLKLSRPHFPWRKEMFARRFGGV